MFSGPETTATLMVTEKQMAFRPHILTMRQCLGLTHTSEAAVLPRTCSVMEGSQGTEFSLSPVPDEVYASGFRDIQDEYDPNRGQWPGTAPASTLATGCRDRGNNSANDQSTAVNMFCLDTRAPLVTEKQGFSCHQKSRNRNHPPQALAANGVYKANTLYIFK